MARGILILAGLGAAAFVALSRAGRWSPGDGPFDLLPEGIGRKPLEQSKVYSASGRQYELTSYQLGSSQKFHVAVAGSDWVSFVIDEPTSKRTFFRAHASDAAALERIRKDFAL